MAATSENEPLEYDLQTLTADFVPDETVAVSVRAMMEHQGLESEQPDAEILRPEAHPDQPRARRASTQSPYDVKKRMLAPVRKLPPETLGEIFLHCLPHQSGTFSHEAPLLLMQVCHRWRRIAAGTPRLWTKLTIGGKLDPCHIIQMWLSSSGTLPIDLDLEGYWRSFSSESEADDHRRAAAFMRLVVQNFHRFHRFSGDLDEHFDHEIHRLGHPIHAPSLVHFELFWAHDDGDMSFPVPHLRGCIRAPKLTSLSLQDASMSNIISFNPASIRRFNLLDNAYDSPEIVVSLGFLKPFGNMSFMNIFLSDGFLPPTVDGGSRVVLPSLETLFITFEDWGLRTFLNAFEVPMLLDLNLSHVDPLHGGTQPSFVAALDSFIGRNPPLQHLSLSNLKYMDSSTFILLLSRLRNLRSLALQNSVVDNSILGALIMDPSFPPSLWICPCLSTLIVDYTNLSYDLLVRIVASRAPLSPDASISAAGCLRLINVAVRSRTREWEVCFTSLREISRRSGHLLEVRWDAWDDREE